MRLVKRVYITDKNVLFEVDDTTTREIPTFWGSKMVTSHENNKIIYNICDNIYQEVIKTNYSWGSYKTNGFEYFVMRHDYDDRIDVLVMPNKTSSKMYKILKDYLIEFKGYTIGHTCGNHVIFTT